MKHPLAAADSRTAGDGELQTARTYILHNPVTSVRFESAVLCEELTVCSGMMDVFTLVVVRCTLTVCHHRGKQSSSFTEYSNTLSDCAHVACCVCVCVCCVSAVPFSRVWL